MTATNNIITQFNTELSCPGCKHDLIVQLDENQSISCPECKASYPIVAGIPILLPEPSLYLAESALILKNHLLEKERHLKDIESGIETNILRRNPLKLLKKGTKVNVEHLQEIMETLINATPKKSLLELAITYKESRSYGFNLKDWRYVRRDWCWLPTSENQLDIIHNTINDVIAQRPDSEHQQTLVLGAGTGRIAVEMARTYNKVFAIDRSFSMVYFYQKVMKEDFYFYEITPINSKTGRDVTRIVKATASPPTNEQPNETLRQLAEKVDFCVGDAMNLALPNESVNSVISAYFTDVLALKLYLDEVYRVLKPGGLFIHFGPFDYPFESITEKLGIDNVKSIFLKYGFTILEDKHVFCHHMQTSVHQSLFSYNNWFFVAQKPEVEVQPKQLITGASVVSIKNKIQFNHTGYISDDGTVEERQSIFINGTEYHGADTMMLILDLVDGQKSINDILDALNEEFEIDDETKAIFFKKIEEYIMMGVLHVKPT